MDNPNLEARFALRLTQAIDESGITGKELATELNHSEATVSNWRNGKYLPDVYTLAVIARYFGKSVDWFLGSQEASDAVRHEHKGIVWRVNMPPNVLGQGRREINLGILLFDALVRQNLGYIHQHQFRSCRQ